MIKKSRSKYFLIIFLCFFILVYGFIEINDKKPEFVRKRSKFIIDLRLKPVDLKLETKGYIFYVNNKIIQGIKEKCISTYNGILSK